MSRNVKLRYFLSRNVEIRAMSRKNGINCDASWLRILCCSGEDWYYTWLYHKKQPVIKTMFKNQPSTSEGGLGGRWTKWIDLFCEHWYWDDWKVCPCQHFISCECWSWEYWSVLALYLARILEWEYWSVLALYLARILDLRILKCASTLSAENIGLENIEVCWHFIWREYWIGKKFGNLAGRLLSVKRCDM